MRIAIVTLNARLTEESNQNINTLFYSDYIIKGAYYVRRAGKKVYRKAEIRC